jgi:hypothetical protein
MKEKKQEWPAARIFHLLGGCRAINNPGPVIELHPNTLEEKIVQFKIDEYGSAYSYLKKLGLRIIGVDFYSNKLEIEERTPPDWRAYRAYNLSWPCWHAAQIWNDIGYNSFEKKNGVLWDLASRIAYQLQVCSWRLREVSESYNKQLNAKLGNNGSEFKSGQHFADGFTIFMFLALQAFLIDACILRDYLAEFAAKFVFILSYPETEISKVTSMSGLVKNILKRKEKNGANSDVLLEQLKEDTSEDGWIHLLGSYRDLVVHWAPLVQAKHKLFAICYDIDIGGEKLPAISCPIPKNPIEIKISRAKGNLFSDFVSQIESFSNTPDINSKIEGLEYVHTTLNDLSHLALQLAKNSPIEPKMMHFDKTNIIGPIIIQQE